MRFNQRLFGRVRYTMPGTRDGLFPLHFRLHTACAAHRQLNASTTTSSRSNRFNHSLADDAATAPQSSGVASQINHCPMKTYGTRFGSETGSRMHKADSSEPVAASATISQKEMAATMAVMCVQGIICSTFATVRYYKVGGGETGKGAFPEGEEARASRARRTLPGDSPQRSPGNPRKCFACSSLIAFYRALELAAAAVWPDFQNLHCRLWPLSCFRGAARLSSDHTARQSVSSRRAQ